MGISSAAETRRGGLNKANLTLFFKYFIIAVILYTVFLGLGMILSNNIEKSSGSVQINNWNYIWVDKKNELDKTVVGWQTAGGIENIANDKKGEYLHLQTTFPANTQNYILSIRSANNPMDIEINGEKVVEQLNKDGLFSNTPLIEILLKPSETDQTIDIFMYVPESLIFSAATEKTGTTTAVVKLPEIGGLVFGAVFAGFGLILLIISVSFAVIAKKYNTLISLAALSTVFGLGVLFSQTGIPIAFFSAPVFYRFAISFLFLASFLMQTVLVNILEIKKEMQWFIYINAIYAVAYLVAPYTIIQQFLINTFGIWSFICLVGFTASIIMNGLPATKGKLFIISLYIAALTGQSIYWLCFVLPIALPVKEAYLTSAGAVIIAFISFLGSGTFTANKIFNKKAGTEVSADLLTSISRILIEKADTNSGHLENVSKYVGAMCRKMKMSPEMTSMVADAALLHDIGKIAIPKAIIEKEGIMTAEEFEQMRCHVLHGYNILTDPNDKFMQIAATISKQHHEKFDGTGYLGMKGSETDLYAQITALADNFDALTAYRSYKKTWSFNEAWEYINAHAGEYFDPELIKVFNSCRKEFWDIYQQRNKNV